MVTFLSPNWIVAVSWFTSTVFSDEGNKTFNKVYAKVDDKTELTFVLPLGFPQVVEIKRAKTLIIDLAIKTEIIVTLHWGGEHVEINKYPSWQDRIENYWSEKHVAKFTIKKVGMEDAGYFLCIVSLEYRYLKECSNILVIVAQPIRPTIGRWGNTFKCAHKTHNYGIGFVVKWQDEKGRELKHSPNQKIAIKKDTIQINNAGMLSKGLSLTCMTSDAFDNNSAIMFSDASEPYVVKPGALQVQLGADITAPFTKNIKVITRHSTKKQELDEKKKIKEDSGSVAWAAIVVILFVFIAFSFLVFHLLMKKKPYFGSGNNESFAER